MENVESPTKPLPLNLSTRPIERNVLKELNSIEGAIKSPTKEAVTVTDQSEIHTKDSISLTNNPPVIVTNVNSDGVKKAVNINLLRVATPTEIQSDDDEFVDCNSTFKSSSSSINDTPDDVTIASDETIQISGDSSLNKSNDLDINACVPNRKLNLGFIETKDSVDGNLEIEKPTVKVLDPVVTESDNTELSKETTSPSFVRDSEIIDQNSTVVIDQCYESIQEIESSLDVAIESNEEVRAHVFESHPSIELKSVNEPIHVIEAPPVIEAEHTTELNPSTASELVIESTLVIESNLEIKSALLIESESSITSQPVIESVIKSEHISESTPVIDSNRQIESEHLTTSEPVIESKTVIESEHSTQCEPVIELENITESTPVIRSNLEIKSVPLIESEPLFTSKPVTESNTANESECATQSETAIESENKTDSTIVIESNLEIKSAPLIESEPLFTSEPVTESNTANESECATRSETAIESENKTDSTIVIESNLEIKSAPLIESEPLFTSEPVIESKTAIESEHATQSKPVIELEHITESTTVIDSNIEVESTTIIESDPLIASEPVIESKTAIEFECATQYETAIESENKTESTCVIESSLEIKPACLTESEPLITSEPIIESVIKSEHISESTPVVDSNGEIESEHLITSEPVFESKTVIESEHATQSEPVIESKTSSEAEHATQSEAAIESKRITESESVIGSNVEIGSAPANESENLIASESEKKSKPAIESEHITELERERESKSIEPDRPIALESVIELEPVINSNLVSESVHVIEKPGIDFESVTKSELSLGDEALNETRILLDSDASVTCQQDTKFISQNNKIDETVVSSSSEILFDGSNVNQVQKKSEFKANQKYSVDSLELESEAQTCSLDSLEMKPDEPPTQTVENEFYSAEGLMRKDTFDLSTPVVTDFEHTSDLNLRRSIAKLSRQEAFADALSPQSGSDSSTANVTVILNTPISDTIDSSDRLKRSGTFEISKVDGDDDMSPLSSDALLDAESHGSDLKVTSVPITNQNLANKNQLPEMVLSSTDFDFLQSRGAKRVGSEEDRRSSLLLRFDPLSGRTTQREKLTPTIETAESSVAIESGFHETSQLIGNKSLKEISLNEPQSQATNATDMSGTVVHDSNNMDNETNSYANNIKTDIAGDVPLSDKKIKFQYADENIRKKMEEYEATEEILVKRLKEKEKTLSKNCAIIEAYEKALAELVADKEKLTDNHEVANERLRQERDIHHQHLMSLEITFSDLHKKYEKSKEIAIQLRERLDLFTEEKAMIDELVKRQESRYEKMKQHALQQLEYANSTLEEQEKNNSRENSRLKALLKIEEVSRNTMQEQLLQKCKENEELVKICDELIGGGPRS